MLWDDIDKRPVSGRGLRYTIDVLHRRLERHLGLHVNRFVQQGALRIQSDQQEQGEPEHQIRSTLSALDPFGYAEAPLEGDPRPFL